MGDTELTVMSRTPANAENDANSEASSEDIELLGYGGLGAQRARLVARQITRGEKLAIFASLLLLGFVYGLESILRGVYQVSLSEILQSSARRSTENTFTYRNIALRNFWIRESLDTRHGECPSRCDCCRRICTTPLALLYCQRLTQPARCCAPIRCLRKIRDGLYEHHTLRFGYATPSATHDPKLILNRHDHRCDLYQCRKLCCRSCDLSGKSDVKRAIIIHANLSKVRLYHADSTCGSHYSRYHDSKVALSPIIHTDTAVSLEYMDQWKC
jgi:hypothetical protein